MIKRGLTLVNALHITASVFINDDESGLHHDYEVWLEELAPHAPIDQAGPEASCTTTTKRAPVHPGQDRRRAPEASVHGPPSEAVVVAVTNGRLDGSTELAEVFGTWERILCQLNG